MLLSPTTLTSHIYNYKPIFTNFFKKKKEKEKERGNQEETNKTTKPYRKKKKMKDTCRGRRKEIQ